jgi:hypothetical protein
MGNPETSTTMDAQTTGRRQAKQKQQNRKLTK